MERFLSTSFASSTGSSSKGQRSLLQAIGWSNRKVKDAKDFLSNPRRIGSFLPSLCLPNAPLLLPVNDSL